MPLPSLDELSQLVDTFFPDEESFQCPSCKDKKTAIIEVKCPCKFAVKSCASCLTQGRNDLLSVLKEHATDCDEGKHIISAMGY